MFAEGENARSQEEEEEAAVVRSIPENSIHPGGESPLSLFLVCFLLLSFDALSLALHYKGMPLKPPAFLSCMQHLCYCLLLACCSHYPAPAVHLTGPSQRKKQSSPVGQVFARVCVYWKLYQQVETIPLINHDRQAAG